MAGGPACRVSSFALTPSKTVAAGRAGDAASPCGCSKPAARWCCPFASSIICGLSAAPVPCCCCAGCCKVDAVARPATLAFAESCAQVFETACLTAVFKAQQRIQRCHVTRIVKTGARTPAASRNSSRPGMPSHGTASVADDESIATSTPHGLAAPARHADLCWSASAHVNDDQPMSSYRCQKCWPAQNHLCLPKVTYQCPNAVQLSPPRNDGCCCQRANE